MLSCIPILHGTPHPRSVHSGKWYVHPFSANMGDVAHTQRKHTVWVEVWGCSAHPSYVPSDYLYLALGGSSCYLKAEDRWVRGVRLPWPRGGMWPGERMGSTGFQELKDRAGSTEQIAHVKHRAGNPRAWVLGK